MNKFSRRGLLGGVAAAVLFSPAVASATGNANRLRLALGRATTPPPPPAAANIRQSQSVYIDLFPEMSGVAADTMVLVTVTGPGVFTPQPAPASTEWQAFSGQPLAYTVRELNNKAKFTTTAASDGQAISIVAAWSGGSATRTFTVLDFPTAITKQLGPRTAVGYGGLIIANELPGTASNWTIKSQTQGGSAVTMFAIWPNNTALTWCDNAGGAASAKYGASAHNGTVVLGTGAYVVVLQNIAEGLPDRTITFDVLTNIRSVAPNPTGTGNHDYTGGFLNQLADTWIGAWCFGDIILCEDGNYNPGNVTTNLISGTGYSLRTVDANTSVAPLGTTNGPWGNGNWTWDGRTLDPGWLSIRPVHPHGAKFGTILFDMRGINTTNVAQGYFGTQFDWMDTLTDTITIRNQGSGQNSFYEWTLITNNLMTGITLSSSDVIDHAFVMRNATSSLVFAVGREGQTVGNLALNTTADVFNTLWYSVTDNDRSQFRWNIALNRTTDLASHPDFIQVPDPLVGRLNSINATTYPMSLIGNRFIKGDCHTSGGFDLPTAQGYNTGALYANGGALSGAVWRIFGNAMNVDYSMGIAVSNVAAGSYIRNNDLVQPTYANNFSGSLPGGTIWVREETAITPGSSFPLTIDYNAITNAGSGNGYIKTTGSPPDPIIAHNLTPVTFATAYNTSALASGPASVWQSRQAIEDGFAPKPGGPMTPAGDGTLARNIGSAGVDGVINARAWKWITSLTPGCS